MADARILVPMHLDAMALNNEASAATAFLRFQMDYTQLLSFQDPEPHPFAGGSIENTTPGIYLHWTLPQALRHGLQRDGQTTFPWVPNRWLVSRVQHGQPAALAVKAWIIESDYWHPSDATAGTSPFVQPTGVDQYGFPVPTTIGRARLLTQVTSLTATPQPFLQAVGPGNALFSAYEPGVQNVLAFFDPLTENDDVTPIVSGTFTYEVVGWYSDPTHDPLHGTTWSASKNPDQNDTFVNGKLPWYLYATSLELPTETLVHAMVSSVVWDRTGDNPPPPTYPVNIRSTVQVAFGSTAIDALSAIVSYNRQNPTEGLLLEAFQYGLLDHFDQPGSSEALQMAIQQHWFDGRPGGTLWTVVNAEPPGSTALPNPPPPPLTEAQQAALVALNVAQRQLDRQARVLDSMQWTLYGLWWMNQWQQQNNPPVSAKMQTWLSNQLPAQLATGVNVTSLAGTDQATGPWYAQQVAARQTLVKGLATTVTTATATLNGLLGPRLLLRSTSLPQFFAPRDPVVLVTGLGRATNLNPTDSLLCRLAPQTVSALTVRGTPYTAASVAGQIPVLADPHGLLPDGVQALNTECLFLAPGLFAQAVLGHPDQAAAVAAAIKALPAPGAAVQFPPIAYAIEVWTQPWVPLLLDWQVTVLKEPAYTTAVGASHPTFNQANWRFNGTDYQWTGPAKNPDHAFDESDSLQMQLTGRTFVTPQAGMTLAAQLDQYVRTHALRDPALEALLKDLDGFIDSIEDVDVLSQRLSGVLGLTIQRGATQTAKPSGPIVDLLGDAQHGIPRPYPATHASFAPTVWDFAPLAGSFFVVNKLTVIDAFGRTIDLMGANLSNAPAIRGTIPEYYFYPIAGPNLISPTGESPANTRGESVDPRSRMLQLPLRATQPARLSFNLLSGDGKNADIALEAGANPVCGWVVPNHLDRSLAIYGPDGTSWGELYLSHQDEETYVPSWQPDPTNPHAPTIDTIPNQYVRGMLQALMGRHDNGKAVSDLLVGIDQSLWTVNPPGDRNDLDLAVLVGRPLSIVRAELTLGLSGLPVVSQDWWNVFDVDPNAPPGDGTQPAALKRVDGDVSSFLWPIRLGSQTLRTDGLIGYFEDDTSGSDKTFETLNVVTRPPEVLTEYLMEIGPATYPTLRFIDDSVASPDPKQRQVVRLTMLVDPRGAVHAFSGLVPAVTRDLPHQFVTPALQAINYLFRSGPFLTTPTVLRMPRPAERRGTWAWFDEVLKTVTPLTPSDSNTTIATTPPIVKEGWLKFTPTPSSDQTDHS